MPTGKFFVSLFCGLLIAVLAGYIVMGDRGRVIAPPLDSSRPAATDTSQPAPVASDTQAKPAGRLAASDKERQLETPLDSDRIRSLATGSAVRLLGQDGQVWGSGVVVHIARGWFDVVTASHVITDANEMTVEWLPSKMTDDPLLLDASGTRKSPSYTVVLDDPAPDLAYLRVASPFPPNSAMDAAAVAGDETSTPDHVWTVDWVDSRLPSIARTSQFSRVIARRSKSESPVSLWRLETPSQPGMSGGALIDPDGRLIGIASGNSEDHAYYCDDAELATFLAKAREISGH